MFRKKTALLFALGSALCSFAGLPIHFPLENGVETVSNRGEAQIDASSFLLKENHYIPSVVGNGLRIYGMADGIRVNKPGIFLPGPCAISFYFFPERLAERMTLASFYLADEQLIALKIQNGRLKMLNWSDPKSRRTYDCRVPLRARQWYHVAWIMDGSRWRCLINGETAADVPCAALPGQFPVQALFIGNDFHSVVHQRDRFVGVLDEFKVHTGAIPHGELSDAVKRLDSASVPPPPAPAVQSGQALATTLDVGSQSFVFNGKKEPVMIYLGGGFLPTAGYSFSTVHEMAGRNITVFRTGLTGGRDFCGGDWWLGIDRYDFSVVDRNIEFALECSPNAKLLLNIHAMPPVWWGRQFPEECTRDIHGNVRQDYTASHSFSSQKWLDDQQKAFEALFNHMQSRPYYKRVIGVFLTTGRYGETIRYGYNSQLYGKELTDYSKPEQLAYRRWLQKRYDTIDAMKQAYATGKVPDSFDQVQLPTPQERKRPDSCYFPDPVVDRGNLDYHTFVNDQQAQAICHYVTMTRKLIGNDKIIGIYYGYMFEDALGHNRCFASESGHFGLGRVLREAPLDFLVGPVGYTQREIGNIGPCMGVPASVALHGKLWLDEADIRTSLNGGKAEYSNAADLEESRAILWRTFGNALVNRSGLWWFPIKGGKSYSHPNIWNDFGKMYREMAVTAQMSPVDNRKQSIAVIMDPESVHYRRFSYHDPVLGNLLTLSRDVFAKSGVHLDTYITDDLELLPDDYPVYIFLNTFYADDAKRKIIARRFKKNGKLLVWTYGSGYYRAATPSARLSVSPAHISDLTGIETKSFLKSVSLNSIPADNPVMAVPALAVKGHHMPAFFVTDPAARPLGIFKAPELSGKIASAFKDMGDWKSVYIGTPEFKVELVRAIARYGGAHVYTDAQNVVVRPGNGHILIHSGHDDRVKINLPRKAAKITVVETDKIIARDTDSFLVEIGRNRTVLLRVE